ncbi:transposase family protein [Actinomyces oris]|nr:transposase family protein [Actinomyces oris]
MPWHAAGVWEPFCKACGAEGQARGKVYQSLAHAPVGWQPTQLLVRLRRFACTHCRRVRRQDTSTLAEPRARLTCSAEEWGLRALALESMSVSRVAAALGVSWHTANNAILTRAEQTFTGNPDRFDGVKVHRRRRFPRALRSRVGGTPCVWRHTRWGDRYVTVIIDLPPVRHRSGPARLLDVVPGRSKKAIQDLALPARPGMAWAGRGGSDGRFHRVPS